MYKIYPRAAAKTGAQALIKRSINMLTKEWKNLKNGSDIRGIAVASRNSPITLTNEAVKRIAAAFGFWVCEKTGKNPEQIKIAVGNDSRLSAPRLKAAVLSALTETGFCCIDCGLMSTPAMFMTCVVPVLDCDASIQLTASHLPYDRNGMKFFTKTGGLEEANIEVLLEYAQEGCRCPDKPGSCRTFDFLSLYAEMLVNKVRNGVNSAKNFKQPLKGFKIVVDAGNGAGGFYVEKVLKPLGADPSGSQFLEPDGRFPNHIPNPENAEAMAAVTSAVKQSGADIGLIFDTDVDRAGAVDSKGKEINRNRLIALISAILLEERKPAVIVTDSITSTGLKKFIENHGGMHRRFKRGYKNVINEAIRLNQAGQYCPLAIETSGHAALKENYFLDDGAYLVTKLLIKMAQLREEGKKLDDLLLGLEEPAESEEFRMSIDREDFKTYGQAVIDRLTEFAAGTPGWNLAPDNYEGVRVSFDKESGDGWLLLRLSLHEPLMPLNIESNTPGGARTIARKLYPLLYRYKYLDTSSLKEYLS